MFGLTFGVWLSDCALLRFYITTPKLSYQLLLYCFKLEPPPPPDNVHLSSVGSRTLTFSWNPVNSSCHVLSYMYIITSVNCGVCPNITTEASATCVSVSVDGSVCLFQVQTTVCNNNHGPPSTSVPIILTGELMASLKIVYPLSQSTLFVYSTYHFTSQNCALFLRKG